MLEWRQNRNIMDSKWNRRSWWLYTILLITFFFFFGFFSIFRRQNLMPVFWAFLAIVIISIIIAAAKKKLEKEISDRKIIFLLYFVSLVPRIFYITFIDNNLKQVSDFAMIVSHADSLNFTDNIQYYRNFVHKMIYPLLLHYLRLNSQKRILYFQCFIVSFNAALIYLIGKKMKNRCAGIIGGLLFSMWPSLILYVSLVSEEHFASVILLVIILLLIIIKEMLEKYKLTFYFIESKSFWKRVIKAIILVLIIGMLLGFISFFKDWGIIVLCAIGVCSIFNLTEKKDYKRFYILIICVGTLFLIRTLTQRSLLMICREQLNGIMPNNNVIIMQMYETLDPDCSGGYDPERCRDYFTFLEKYEYDYRTANSMVIKALLNKMMRNSEKMPALLFHKGQVAYKDNRDMFSWAFSGVESKFSEDIIDAIKKLVYVDKVYFNFIVILMMMTAALAFKFKKEVYFGLLIILGGGVAGLLVESQGRYKYSIEPLWCIMAAVALCMIVDVFFNRYPFLRNNDV